MSDAVETVELDNGKRAIIAYDECPESPRSWDNLGFIVCKKSSRMRLGDAQVTYDYTSDEDYFAFVGTFVAESPDYRGELLYAYSDYTFGDLSRKALEAMIDREIISLPVYKYEHGRIILNTYGFSCPWDSGQIGWIFTTKEKARKWFNVKRLTKKVLQKVLDTLRKEVEQYSQYVDGEVYCVQIQDAQGEVIDTCGSLYSIEEAREFIKEYALL